MTNQERNIENIKEILESNKHFKGLLAIEYHPTVCDICNKLLSKTFTLKGDEGWKIEIHIICTDCWKELKTK